MTTGSVTILTLALMVAPVFEDSSSPFPAYLIKHSIRTLSENFVPWPSQVKSTRSSDLNNLKSFVMLQWLQFLRDRYEFQNI